MLQDGEFSLRIRSYLRSEMALLDKSRHEDSLYESSVIAGGYEQLDTYKV